jgi:hypothetical protein
MFGDADWPLKVLFAADFELRPAVATIVAASGDEMRIQLGDSAYLAVAQCCKSLLWLQARFWDSNWETWEGQRELRRQCSRDRTAGEDEEKCISLAASPRRGTKQKPCFGLSLFVLVWMLKQIGEEVRSNFRGSP